VNTIHFHGHLREKFGDRVKFDIRTPKEAIRALCYQLPGFREEFARGSYSIVRNTPDTEKGFCYDTETVGMYLGRADLHFVPSLSGEGGRGLGKIILGTLLIASAFIFAPPTVAGFASGAAAVASSGGLASTAFSVAGIAITYSQIASTGAFLLFSGISQLLAPTVKPTTPQSVDQEASFLFNGPVNVIEQGGPVPLAYGICMVGSVVISAGISVEEVDI